MQRFTGVIKVDKLFEEMSDECFCSSSSANYPNHTKTEFGTEFAIDLYGCDKEILNSKKELTKFIKILSSKLNIKSDLKPTIHIYDDLGSIHNMSLVWIVNDGSLVIHLSKTLLQAHISMATQTEMDQKKLETVRIDYFKSKDPRIQVLQR